MYGALMLLGAAVIYAFFGPDLWLLVMWIVLMLGLTWATHTGGRRA